MEDDKNKKDSNTEEEDATGKVDEITQSSTNENNQSETHLAQVKPPSPSSNIDSPLEDVDTEVKKTSDNFSTESIACSTPDIPDNSCQSNTDLVTTSPICSPVGKAVVVDLHNTKVGFADEDKEKNTEKDTPEGK